MLTDVVKRCTRAGDGLSSPTISSRARAKAISGVISWVVKFWRHSVHRSVAAINLLQMVMQVKETPCLATMPGGVGKGESSLSSPRLKVGFACSGLSSTSASKRSAKVAMKVAPSS
ncbi:A disintegrin and metalloproteinase with thrombospondin motifs adt-1 [Frankliniella fusca]|uniref:A disintegrin and metalloproteinase with thrombospondin motifs adt-1 n=1 Tax=Frankliniella fusca TaxID=407009 RepID=A0AAE1HR71_9NEOP|nr:A disintegrin and metalloproteinase with thrombospondin motifs adt-1 [Frankliniella fusca]